MKRVWFVSLVLILLVALVGEVFAQIELKRMELEKVRTQIKVLDQRIAKAQKAKQVKLVIQLRAEREKLVGQMRQLEAEVAKLSRVSPKPAAAAPSVPAERPGFLVEAGYGGGAGIIGAGYELPLGGVNLQLRADYGIGNKFSILAGMLSGTFPFGNHYLGLEVGMANYSEKVSGVPGISGTIDKGSRVGFGVFGGTKVGVVKVQAGYDTALGLTAGVSYKF